MKKKIEATEETTQKKVVTLLENLKSPEATPQFRSKAKQHLNKLYFAFPEVVAAAGYTPEDGTVPTTVRVFKYGCMAPPVLADSTSDTSITFQMRLRDDLYNQLVQESKGIFAEVLGLLSEGPAFYKASGIQAAIDQLYSQLRSANQQVRAISKAPEVDTTREQITKFRSERSQLMPEVYREIREYKKSAFAKGLKVRVQKLAQEWAGIYSEKGLFWMNAEPVQIAFVNAFVAAIDDPKTLFTGLKFRYQRRDGSYPEQITTWEAWDGQGQISVRAQGKNQPLDTVLTGTNTLFQLRPMIESDIPLFPLMRKVDLAKKASRNLYVATIKVGPGETTHRPLYALVPIKFHRPLPKGCQFLGASVSSTRVGLRNITSLTVTIKEEKPALRTEGCSVRLNLEFAKDSSAFGSVTRTQEIAGETVPAELPEGITVPWVTAIGDLLVNDYIPSANKECTRLDSHTAQHVNVALKGIADWVSDRAFPAWFAGLNLNPITRNAMRRTYNVWVERIATDAALNSGVDRRSILQKFGAIRREASQTVVENWTGTLANVQQRLLTTFGMSPEESQLLALLLLGTERFEHLYPWSVNLRSKSLRRRQHEYRQLAKEILVGAKEIHLPGDTLNKRYLSDQQKAVAPSELLMAICQRAVRDGVKVIADRKPKAALEAAA